VMSVTRSIVGRLVIGCQEPGQCCPGGDALVGRLLSHRSGALPITRGKYPAMRSSLPP
jgi:hypothetical protein